jgi:hypothetical protein
MASFPIPPWPSLFALLISLAACYGYCALFGRAVDGFSIQLNKLAAIGDIQLPFSLIMVGAILTVLVLVFYLVGSVATESKLINFFK